MAKITYRIDKLIPWSINSEVLVDNIPETEVVRIGARYGFPKKKVEDLKDKDKYNGKYNPSCDTGWTRLTKVFNN